jgi:hypothetical protein
MGFDVLLQQYPQLALIGVIVLLYVGDLLVLAPADHVFGVSGSSGRVARILPCGRGVIVAGKVLYLLPPMTPWLPVHQLDLRDVATGPGPAAVADAPVLATMLVAAAMCTVLALLAVSGGHSGYVLGALILLYGSAFGLVITVGRSVRVSIWRALECIVCPPNALNLLRRTTLAIGPHGLGVSIGSQQSMLERLRMARCVEAGEVYTELARERLRRIAGVGE